MTRIGLNILLILLIGIGISADCNRLTAQAHSFAPLVDGHFVDFINTRDNQTILLTTQGSYILSQKEAFPLTSLGNIRLQRRLQSRNGPLVFLPLDNGSMAQVLRDGELEVQNYLDPAIYLRYESGDNWKVTDKIWYRSKEDVNFAYKLFDQFNPEETTYTDGVVYQQVAWLSTSDKGIVRIEQPRGQSNFRVRAYKDDDLLSNECTALCRYGTTGVLVGHYGGLTSLGEFQLDFSDLTNQAVKQIIVEDDLIWCLTQDAIIKVTPNAKATLVDLPHLEENEQLLRLEIRDDKSLMLLSEESLHYIPNQPYDIHEIENASSEAIQFYQIRSNKYYTDGQGVYGFNPVEQIWELHKGKKVPEKVLSAEDRVTLLFGDSTGMTIAKDSAQTLARITEAKSDILNVSRMRGLEYLSLIHI